MCIFFTYRVSLCAANYSGERLIEFSGVTLSCFTLSRYFSECNGHKTGTLVQPIIQGNFVFNVICQTTCEYRREYKIKK